jgi:CRP-like cAMP-binding protein
MYDEFIKYLKAYKPKEVLIKEGDSDTEFFCLLQGKVGIWKGPIDKPDGMVKIGEIEEKGTYFGEMSVLLNEKRTASIIAKEPVKVLKFPAEMLSQLVLSQPKLGLKLMTALADRLRGTTDKQQNIAIQRNEIRDDATFQFIMARETFQKLFMMLSALQMQQQLPALKAIVSFMSRDKMMQGGKKIRVDQEFLKEIPQELVEPIKKAYHETFLE